MRKFLLKFKHTLIISNSKVANVQQIKKFTLLSNEWTDSSGELTPSLKLKRHVVTERYKDEIESMYEEA